jgi:hypothetical protein
MSDIHTEPPTPSQFSAFDVLEERFYHNRTNYKLTFIWLFDRCEGLHEDIVNPTPDRKLIYIYVAACSSRLVEFSESFES